MPRVPTYSSPQVRSRPIGAPYSGAQMRAPLSGPRASPDAFGAGVGQGLQRLGATAGEIFIRAKQEAEAAAVQQAEADLSKIRTGLLYDRKNGLLYQQGENAIGMADAIYQQFEKARANAIRNMPSESARRLLDARTTGMVDGVLREGERHIAKQIDRQKAAAAKASIDNELEFLGEAYDSPEAWDYSIAMIESTAKAEAQRQGLGPEEQERVLRGLRSRAMEKRLGGALRAGDTATAVALFTEHRDTLGEELAAQYGPAIEKMRVGSAAREAERRLQAMRPGDLEAQIAIARRIEDGDVQDATIARLKETHALSVKAHTSTQRRHFGSVMRQLEEDEWLDTNSPDFHALDDEWASKALRARRRMIERREELESDRMREARDQDRDAMAALRAVPVEELEGRHLDEFGWGTNRGRNEGRAYVNQALGALKRGQAVSLTKLREMVETEAYRAGRTDKAYVEKLKSEMDGWWFDRTANEKAPPPDSDVRQELGKRLIDQRWFGRGPKPIEEQRSPLAQEALRRQRAEETGIPEADRQEITRAFREVWKRAPTEAEIQDRYNRARGAAR